MASKEAAKEALQEAARVGWIDALEAAIAMATAAGFEGQELQKAQAQRASNTLPLGQYVNTEDSQSWLVLEQGGKYSSVNALSKTGTYTFTGDQWITECGNKYDANYKTKAIDQCNSTVRYEFQGAYVAPVMSVVEAANNLDQELTKFMGAFMGDPTMEELAGIRDKLMEILVKAAQEAKDGNFPEKFKACDGSPGAPAGRLPFEAFYEAVLREASVLKTEEEVAAHVEAVIASFAKAQNEAEYHRNPAEPLSSNFVCPVFQSP